MVVLGHAVGTAVVPLCEGILRRGEWQTVDDLVKLALACFAAEIVEFAGPRVADEAKHALFGVQVIQRGAEEVRHMREQVFIEERLSMVYRQRSVRDARELSTVHRYGNVPLPFALLGEDGRIRDLVEHRRDPWNL
jgi:hypothetical protein